MSVRRGLEKGKAHGHYALGLFFFFFFVSFGLGTCEAKGNRIFKRNRGGRNKIKGFEVPASPCDTASPCERQILVSSRVLSGWRPALCWATEKRQDQILQLQAVESNSRTATKQIWGARGWSSTPDTAELVLYVGFKG